MRGADAKVHAGSMVGPVARKTKVTSASSPVPRSDAGRRVKATITPTARRKAAKTVGHALPARASRASQGPQHPQLAIRQAAAIPASPAEVFGSKEALPLRVTLPLQEIIQAKEAWVAGGKVGPRPEPRAGQVAVGGQAFAVEAKVRGNSSLTAYGWPKLGLKWGDGEGGPFAGLRSINLLNHTFADFGADAERFPWREASAYAVLEALEIPTLKARAAEVRYEDNSAGPKRLPRQTHQGLLVEDDKDAAQRLGGVSVDLNALQVIDPPIPVLGATVVRLELASRLLGNQDSQLLGEWDGPVLKMNSSWNYDAVEHPAGPDGQRRVTLLPSDFDRTYWVNAPRYFDPNGLYSWLEQSYWNQPEATLDAARAIARKKKAVLATLRQAPLDDEAKVVLQARVELFFKTVAKFLRKPTPKPE